MHSAQLATFRLQLESGVHRTDKVSFLQTKHYRKLLTGSLLIYQTGHIENILSAMRAGKNKDQLPKKVSDENAQELKNIVIT